MYKNKKVIAIIPARSGSKGIKNKNIMKLNGMPLISYSISYAKKSKLIDRVFVSTDGKEIANISKKFNAEIISRPKNLCNDIIMPDYAVIHGIKNVLQKLKYYFDYVVFLQPTSPLRAKNEIDKAIKHCIDKNLDTVFSSINYKPFLWRKKGKFFSPISFNPKKRKRRQRIEDINETGSYYVVKAKSFLKHRNRFGKKISNYLSDFHSILEIDNMADHKYIESLLKSNIPQKNRIFVVEKK